MVPDKFNMVDMEGIDIVFSYEYIIHGLYQKLVESIAQCRYQCLYNWYFDGVLIPPSYVEMTVDPDNGNLLINTGIHVTPQDVIVIDAIPEGNFYTIQEIASGQAFYRKDLVLPVDITEIASHAFFQEDLKSVVGIGVTKINTRAFMKDNYAAITLGTFEYNFPNLQDANASYIFGFRNMGNKPAVFTALNCGSSNFEGTTNLPSIKFTRATYIGADTVYNSNTLTEIIINSPSPQIAANAFRRTDALTDIYVPWSEGDVANAPWGAVNATVHYNTEFDANGDPVI